MKELYERLQAEVKKHFDLAAAAAKAASTIADAMAEEAKGQPSAISPLHDPFVYAVLKQLEKENRHEAGADFLQFNHRSHLGNYHPISNEQYAAEQADILARSYGMNASEFSIPARYGPSPAMRYMDMMQREAKANEQNTAEANLILASHRQAVSMTSEDRARELQKIRELTESTLQATRERELLRVSLNNRVEELLKKKKQPDCFSHLAWIWNYTAPSA